MERERRRDRRYLLRRAGCHARKTAAAAVQLGSGEVFKARLAGSPAAAIEWLQTLPGEVRAVYEAGPTGFGLARAGGAAGIDVMVCSPGAIPRQPGDRIKTDTRDALKLARLHAAGQLRPVVVPAVELEALRDLVRAREDLRGDLMRAAPDLQAAAAPRPRVRRARGDVVDTAPAVAEHATFRPAADRNGVRRVSRASRGVARSPRAPGPPDRRAGRSGAVGADRRPVGLPARRRHADRGRPDRRDRRHQRLQASQAAGQLPRAGSV